MDRNAKQKHVWRAILESGDGCSAMEIMRQTGKSKTCVWRWQQRSMEEGVDGLLYDATRPAGTPPAAPWKMREVVELAKSPPYGETTHWTLRAMAARVGLAFSTVGKIWQDHGLVPHRFRELKVSNDPAFVDKLRDIAGLYVNPLEHAIVLSVDEKSRIQALGRTQAPLPMKKGHPEARTHDCKGYGTTTLFAALNVLEGTVIGKNMERHRHLEFIAFLDTVERQLPRTRGVHVILGNHATHKTDAVRAWLDRHPNRTFHFTATSSSWLNAVEGFFAKLTRRRLKHTICNSVTECETAIRRFIEEHNRNEAQRFRWTANPEKIIAARKRGFQVLDSYHQADPGTAPNARRGRTWRLGTAMACIFGIIAAELPDTQGAVVVTGSAAWRGQKGGVHVLHA